MFNLFIYPFLQSILHICMVYITPYTETQSNILAIVILIQPELESDILTRVLHVFDPRFTTLNQTDLCAPG